MTRAARQAAVTQRKAVPALILRLSVMVATPAVPMQGCQILLPRCTSTLPPYKGRRMTSHSMGRRRRKWHRPQPASAAQGTNQETFHLPKNIQRSLSLVPDTYIIPLGVFRFRVMRSLAGFETNYKTSSSPQTTSWP